MSRAEHFIIFCENWITGSIISTPPKNPNTEGDLSAASAETVTAPFDTIIDETEVVIGDFRSKEGIVRIEGGERTAIDQTVLTAVTNRRILFTTPGGGSTGAVTLGYDELAAVTVGDPMLSATTTEGIGLEWRGSETVPTALAAHLRWIGQVRAAIRTLGTDVDLAAGAIRSHADAMEWEEGLQRYRDRRQQLDAVLNDVFCTEAVAETALAPELTDLERTLETAHTRLFIERGRSRLELGRQLIENGDYEQGRKVLGQAQADHKEAKELRDAVERADAFQFGTQRDLAEDIESLGWKIETVAAEPIRQAHEAKITAQSADDPAEAVSHWERAFKRYGHVLTLEWGSDERNLAGDPATVRPELEGAATRLIELHSTLADVCWNEGAEQQDTGELKAALQCCLDAQKHLERAHELAAEFDPGRVNSIATRLETMADAVMRMRNSEPTADSETADTTEPGGPARSDAETKPASKADEPLPSADELAEIDTHHEIALDSEELQAPDRERQVPTEEAATDDRRDSAEKDPQRH